MSLTEMQQDLAIVTRDVHRLEAVCDNLSLFIRESDGEDRSSFKTCLMKCEVALEDGRRLIPKITGAIAKEIQSRVVNAVKTEASK